MAIEFRNVHCPPLDGFSGAAPDGCVVGVIGERGSGKSMLLKLAAGLQSCEVGEVIAGGTRRYIGPQDRLIAVLKTLRDASGWETRPSPHPGAVSTGSTAVRGRGVSVMLRSGTYWACVCQIAVTPSTGKIVVEKYTIVVDPGIVVNPMQLKRNVEGGAIMGISHALFEEVSFDESRITTEDWNSYPIPTMSDIPDVKVVLLNNPKVGAYGGGSEAANALAAPAIAAALHDATGKMLRRLPLKPAYVLDVLKT